MITIYASPKSSSVRYFWCLEKIEEVQEQMQAFFKCVYNKTTDDWFLLDFKP